MMGQSIAVRMKKTMVQRAAALIATLMLVLVAVTPANAGLVWCKSDPIVRFNGQTVQVLVSIPDSYVSKVNGPIRVEFKTPQQVERELVFVDSGFNGYGEDVSFSDIGDGFGTPTGYRIKIKVTVPIQTSNLVPTLVEVIGADGVVQTFEGNHKGTSFYVNMVDAPMALLLAGK